jgi:hypothetical protein
LNVYRIRAELVVNAAPVPGQFVELLAGLTPTHHIAQGQWYGAVFDGREIHPFVLTQDGRCQYAGGPFECRYFTIVTRPVSENEIFELTWADASDRYCYKVVSVQRQNLTEDS